MDIWAEPIEFNHDKLKRKRARVLDKVGKHCETLALSRGVEFATETFIRKVNNKSVMVITPNDQVVLDFRARCKDKINDC
jgi:hypothetical protein